MLEVIVFAEGPSDEQFLKRVVAPALHGRQIFLKPQTLHTSRDSTGGAINFDRLCHNVRNTLRQSAKTYLTTFFDLYALDSEMPGIAASRNLDNPLLKAARIEAELHAALRQKLDFRADRLFVYIQPYELEGLFFSNTELLAQSVPDWTVAAESLKAVRQSFETPEHINDGYDTKPSARLATLLQPRYRKTTHAPLIGQKMGLSTIVAQCKHFASWVDHLGRLTPL
ncbi:DUF4276 family protein [Variovorax sp. PAMC 28711]|uniref:DUF4276 family protein n=1 Tax=Variovorax sp. PAMC 28711 TaxID=1795631 RepID=UPI00078C1D2E|nr:DUF4276 family protein [Variovorax sp. PAMC 28711]AMM26001.1 hypothetical protein AX767_17815 [Variovorax sp. PAMC 28711]